MLKADQSSGKSACPVLAVGSGSPHHRVHLAPPQQIQWRLTTQRLVGVDQERELHPGIRVVSECTQDLFEVFDRAGVLELAGGVLVSPPTCLDGDQLACPPSLADGLTAYAE